MLYVIKRIVKTAYIQGTANDMFDLLEIIKNLAISQGWEVLGDTITPYNDIPRNGGLARLEAIDTFQQQELERIKAYYTAIGDAELQSEQARTDMFRLQMQTRLSFMSSGFDALGGLAKAFYDASNGENKTAM